MQFRVNEPERAKIVGMEKSKPRDPAVTEFVRERYREYQQANPGVSGKEVAKMVGISESMVSSLETIGIAGRSIEGFAKLFGYKDSPGLIAADAMRIDAYKWWLERHEKPTDRATEPSVEAAVRRVLELQPWASEIQVRSILHRFEHKDFDGRTEDFWFAALIQELQQDTFRRQRQAGRREPERVDVPAGATNHPPRSGAVPTTTAIRPAKPVRRVK